MPLEEGAAIAFRLLAGVRAAFLLKAVPHVLHSVTFCMAAKNPWEHEGHAILQRSTLSGPRSKDNPPFIKSKHSCKIPIQTVKENRHAFR